MRFAVHRTDPAGAPAQISIGAAATLSTVGILAQGLLRFSYAAIIGRVAGVATLGVVNSLVSAATLTALLWPSATGSAAAKFVARSRGAGDPDAARAAAAFLGRRTIVSAFILALFAGIGAWLILPVGPWEGLATALLVLTYSGYAFVRGLAFGIGRVRRATFWDIVMSASALIMLVLVLAFDSPAVLLLPLVGGYAIFTAQGWPRSSSHRISKTLRREIDHFVVLGVLGTLASAGFLQLSMVLAGAVESPRNAGLYAAALTLALPASLAARSLSLVLFPSMAEAVGRGDLAELRRKTDIATRALVVTMVPLFGGLALFAGPLLTLSFGSEFAPATGLLVVLLGAVFVTTVPVAAVSSLTSRSQRGMRTSATLSGCGAAVGVIVWAVTIPPMGVRGVAIGFLAGSLVIGLGPLVVARRWDGYRWVGLAIRGIAGTALIIALLVVQDRWQAGPLVTCGLAAGMLLIWTAAVWAEVRDGWSVARAGLAHRSSNPPTQPQP